MKEVICCHSIHRASIYYMQLKCNLTLSPPNHLVEKGTITPIAVPLLVAEVYVFFFDLSLPINATIFKVSERGLISPRSPHRRLNVGTGKMTSIIAA
jgi:hypothetical protein